MTRTGTAVSSALVIGAGLAGTAAAAVLAEGGVAVDLVEAKPDVTAVGSGITLQGNALRVLRDLDVLDGCLTEGYTTETLVLRAPDPAATVVARLADVRTGGPDLPASMGMYRPTLARVLTDRATRAGVKLRLGTTAEEIDDRADGVTVRLSDGSSARYDVVVAADGVRSATRRLLGVELTTRPLGMGIWRVFAPRPAEVTTSELVYGGPCYIAGITPTSEDTLYAFLVEEARDEMPATPQERVEIVRRLSQPYHGPWDSIRASLGDPDAIHYTVFETHLMDGSWARERVVFIGDAAHTCPPTIAQGGAMALEDGVVLGEMLLAADRVDADLWAAFTERRLARVGPVVEASVQLAQWQLDHVQGDVPGLVGRIAALTAQPA